MKSRDRSCVKMRENGKLLPIHEFIHWKTIIELGYRKISWFVSISQINYLPHPFCDNRVRVFFHSYKMRLLARFGPFTDPNDRFRDPFTYLR